MLDPKLQTLLNTTAKGDRSSPFFETLYAISDREVWSKKFSGLDDGVAVLTEEQGVLVIVRRYSCMVQPGPDRYSILLLNMKGALLDSVSCEVNNRLTAMYGFLDRLSAEILSHPASDHARVIVRYDSDEGVSGNFAHYITTSGGKHCFRWDQEAAGTIPTIEYSKQGLCRVAVASDRLYVTFPPLDRAWSVVDKSS